MAKSLDFNTVKKQYLTVKLADAKGTTLLVATPTKRVMSELMLLQSSIEGMSEDGDIESMDALYGACARILSRNKAGIVITKELLEDIFDFEDVVILFNAYMNFISEVLGGKN